MPPLISLIPNSGVQFWDVDLDADALPRQARVFWEEPLGGPPDANGAARVKLHELVADAETGQLVEALSRDAPPPEETYPVGARHALEMHMGRWVPLPYFMLLSRSAAGVEAHERGPSNWARGRIVPHPNAGPGRTHRLTLAFDTALLPRDGGPYAAPAPEDSAASQEFVFVAELAANAWFINEAWVGKWLREMYVETLMAARGGRALRPEDLARGCEHYARYQVMLGLLAAAEALPRIRMVDVVSRNLGYLPVAVDLVLDLGNARTCGILIEEHPGQGMNLSDSYPLALRDLSQPECLHEKPFDSRVEFARARFGRDAVSRESGRASAFSWPSPVRVGPEAVRLAGARLGNEGSTGLSSPKRYLWDTRPATQSWRFNALGDLTVKTDPPVSGPLMKLLSEDGSVLRQRRGQPAVRARFSRSSVFTLMLAEILLQALGQMNAPGTRAQRRDADKPRQLRTLLMTMPPGMPVAEQHILRARAQGAVMLAWDMLGWTGVATPPRVLANLDEATATQIVWLHNEVTERLQGDAGALMDLVGRVRPELGPQLGGAPCLRVASIDIGGGTTDLTVTTYGVQGGEAIVPRPEFRESFKIAGDDVLERVITAVALPAFAAALKQAGVGDPRALLNRALGQDQGGQSEPERHRRRLFVSMVLEPLGIAILRAYEGVEGRAVGQVLQGNVGAILAEQSSAGQAKAGRVMDYLEEAAAAAGASGFKVADVMLEVSTQQIEPVIAAVLGPVLADLCEVVWSYDCDVLLLSGRPSRLRVVGDIVLAKAPVPPHRIVGMHRYRVGDKYPFRDAANRIDDPKTTVAVGAALCVQAEGRLRNFMLRGSMGGSGRLSMRSTARYIGKMDNNGQIRNENVLLSNLDLDGPPAQDVSFKVMFQTVTQLGFRQLPIARWTATPLYMMEFSNPDDAQRMDLPLTVTVARREIDPDTPEAEMQRETFVVDEVTDASGATQRSGDVRLRLQTIDDQDGYWRDTGRLSIP